MKSRLAVILVLALGVTLSGTGAALAVSGMSEGGSASQAQYPEEGRCEEGKTVGPNGEPCKPYTCAEGATIGPHGESCVHEAANHEAEPIEEEQVQEVQQVSSGGGGSLPFTGFLAIPVLLIGIGLLGAGVAMRLRMRSWDGG